MRDDVMDSLRNLHYFKGINTKPKEWKFGCAHEFEITLIESGDSHEAYHYVCRKCGERKIKKEDYEDWKRFLPSKEPKRKKQMFGKKKELEKRIDMMQEEIVSLGRRNIWDINIAKSGVVVEKIVEEYGDKKHIKLTVPELKEKASIKSVTELKDKVSTLSKIVDAQGELIKKLCPHKDVEVSIRELPCCNGLFKSYIKTCKVCGNKEGISEKEYYETQKGIVDAKLKEVE